jgi:hypothetical protein
VNPVVIAALVGAGAGVLGPVFVLFLNRALENSAYVKVPKDRIRALSGKWHGTVREKDNQNRVLNSYPTDLTLTISRRRVTGHGELRPGTEPIRTVMNGMVLDDCYIVGHYTNADKTVRHYGSFLFRLSDDAHELAGEVLFCGLGNPISRADVKLTK